MSLSFKTILKDMNLDLNRRHVAVMPIRRWGNALTFTVRLRSWIYCAATRSHLLCGYALTFTVRLRAG